VPAAAKDRASSGEVALFDSLQTSTALSNATIRSNLFAIAYAPDSAADSLRVVKRAGQIQNGSTQCGDFCIAWLVAFAFGDDLQTMSQSSFDQQQMRLHIRQCLAANRFERFPVMARDRRSVFSREQV